MLSLPALARILPSGENNTEKTRPVCPRSMACSFPLARSHNRTVWSSPPLARVLPSGENEKDETEPLGPCNCCLLPSGGHNPQSNRIVSTAACENTPVRREQHGTNRTGIIPKRGYLLTRVRVPQSNRSVIASAGKRSPIRRERHGKSTGRMPPQPGLLPTAGHVPQMNVSQTGGERASIRRKRQFRKSPHMPL